MLGAIKPSPKHKEPPASSSVSGKISGDLDSVGGCSAWASFHPTRDSGSTTDNLPANNNLLLHIINMNRTGEVLSSVQQYPGSLLRIRFSLSLTESRAQLHQSWKVAGRCEDWNQSNRPRIPCQFAKDFGRPCSISPLPEAK